MAISQGKVLTNIEKVVQDISEENFIFDFLLAYGFPKASVTRLQKGDKTRNVAHEGDIAIKKQIYFKQVPVGSDLEKEVEALSKDDLLSRHDIRFLIVTDFQDLAATDLAAEETLNIPIDELDKNYTFFLPLAGFEKAIIHSEHPADVRASEKMGRLFDLIKENNDLTQPEDIHALNVFLTRLLFCFYAEDTGIFEEQQMTAIIKSTTQVDGSDLDEFLYDLFTVLNLPEGSEQRKTMPAHLQAFPYVNGGLFKVDEPVPAFSKKSRRMLLECGDLSWAEINPDIFGSMFQAVIDEEQRGSLGQHYTSVSNIMKVIQPLFLDMFRQELSKSKGNEKRLKGLLLRLQNIAVFDPACGSGNFLIIAYKELRKLEMEVIDAVNEGSTQAEMYYSGIKLSQFYGVEIDDFAHEIGVLSLWLAEHQMNQLFEKKFGHADPLLPLGSAGNILCGNSLLMDWGDFIPVDSEVFICGNPPFKGWKNRSKEQSQDMEVVFNGFRLWKPLDLVAAWFWKAAQFVTISPKVSFSFVATNSITQGEQVGILWRPILNLGVEIEFCYQSFMWKNNARDNAVVHVVVIGMSKAPTSKRIYSKVDGQVLEKVVQNISPYLVEGDDVIVDGASSPITPRKEMVDGNNYANSLPLILSPLEKEELILKEPQSEKWIKKLLGADEFMKGKERWCLWLVGIELEEINETMPLVAERIEKVRISRLAAKDVGAHKLAERPHQFRDTNNPERFILVPRVTSERREHVPVGFFDGNVISTNKNLVIENGGLLEAGIIMSKIHLDWMRAVGGRMKSDYSYSAAMVYNTFPWPELDSKRVQTIEKLSEDILLVREDYPDLSLAKLYDTDKMPEPLREAHKSLDEAVDRMYRRRPFEDSVDRLELLFDLYMNETAK